MGVIKGDTRSLDYGSYQLPEIFNLQTQQCQESLGDSASAAVQGAPFELLSLATGITCFRIMQCRARSLTSGFHWASAR